MKPSYDRDFPGIYQCGRQHLRGRKLGHVDKPKSVRSSPCSHHRAGWGRWRRRWCAQLRQLTGGRRSGRQQRRLGSHRYVYRPIAFNRVLFRWPRRGGWNGAKHQRHRRNRRRWRKHRLWSIYCYWRRPRVWRLIDRRRDEHRPDRQRKPFRSPNRRHYRRGWRRIRRSPGRNREYAASIVFRRRRRRNRRNNGVCWRRIG